MWYNYYDRILCAIGFFEFFRLKNNVFSAKICAFSQPKGHIMIVVKTFFGLQKILYEM